MKTTLFTNAGKTPVYKGGVLIQAGESRELPAHLVQQSKPSTSEQQGNSTGEKSPYFEPVAFLDRSLRDMEDELKTLGKAQLDQLKTLENGTESTPRKNILEAIDVAILGLAT